MEHAHDDQILTFLLRSCHSGRKFIGNGKGRRVGIFPHEPGRKAGEWSNPSRMRLIKARHSTLQLTRAATVMRKQPTRPAGGLSSLRSSRNHLRPTGHRPHSIGAAGFPSTAARERFPCERCPPAIAGQMGKEQESHWASSPSGSSYRGKVRA
jgi:hypothetical protein